MAHYRVSLNIFTSMVIVICPLMKRETPFIVQKLNSVFLTINWDRKFKSPWHHTQISLFYDKVYISRRSTTFWHEHHWKDLHVISRNAQMVHQKLLSYWFYIKTLWANVYILESFEINLVKEVLWLILG
jgi:hypothetical protein